jgi:hypothetical protein
VNTANGDFVFEVSDGYLISGGEIVNLCGEQHLPAMAPKPLLWSIGLEEIWALLSAFVARMARELRSVMLSPPFVFRN